MRALVRGEAGFLGSYLIPALLERRAEVKKIVGVLFGLILIAGTTISAGCGGGTELVSTDVVSEIRIRTAEGIDDGLKHVYFRVLNRDGEAIKFGGHIKFRIYDTASGQEEALLYETEFDIHPDDYEHVRFPGFTYHSRRPDPWGYKWEVPLADIGNSSSIVYGRDETVQARAELVFTTPQGREFEASEVTRVFGTLANWKVEIGEVTVTRTADDRHPWRLSIPATIINTGEIDLTNLETRCYITACVAKAEAMGGDPVRDVIWEPAPNVDYIAKGASEQVALYVRLGHDLYSGQEYCVRAEVEVVYHAVGRTGAGGQSASKDISFILP